MYARHVPVAVFSLALVIDGNSKVGVVYDPFTDNIYTAIKGEGAYKNNEKIFVSDIILNDKKSIVQFDMWPEAEYNISEVVSELVKKTYVVGIGSVIRAAMLIASGEFTAAVFPGTKGKNCDIAAVKVIIEEAGGKVTDLFGNEQRYDRDIKGAIMSNSKVHDEIAQLTNKYVK